MYDTGRCPVLLNFALSGLLLRLSCRIHLVLAKNSLVLQENSLVFPKNYIVLAKNSLVFWKNNVVLAKNKIALGENNIVFSFFNTVSRKNYVETEKNRQENHKRGRVYKDCSQVC